ncbi:helix-turn-helix transcriptional regulator [Brachybacterium sp. DNPG3]
MSAITPPGPARVRRDPEGPAGSWDGMLRLARERPVGLEVADLAAAAGYSPFHFARLFRARRGISPGQHLTALRIDAAERLLLEEDMPVIDVATAVGFDSLSSFSRRFRSTVGIPPGALRRLADKIADRPPRPFRLLPSDEARVRVRLELPPSVGRRGDASVWIGWYPQPAAFGLPAAGVLVRGVEEVALPLCPGAPFLLGFAVPAHADARDLLAPDDPVVAVHPVPLAAPPAGGAADEPAEVVLRFGALPPEQAVPVLSALPSLSR